MKNLLKRLVRGAGYEVINLHRPRAEGLFPPDFDQADMEAYVNVRPFTQTSPERVYMLNRAIAYLLAHQIPGSFVECGVWKGGSMMAVARALHRANRNDIDLYLYDTFEGMPPPVAADGDHVRAEWERHQGPTHNTWNRVGFDEVQANMAGTGYPTDRIHYVVGKVEDTLPASAPETVALLRLDTDFYESTRHELIHLFPRLSRGGVLIIDDYGSFEGARKAVDEYLREMKVCLFLNRVDSDCRIAVKL